MKHSYSNHLINEKSPYLLSHAHNPVEWYPWCQEAFRKAKEQNKPVFLSIGYSTCHWCHVMERESFENEETAQLLNRYFVSIKVDREERPDIDSVYMAVCQAVNRSGGWPLTVFMTPEQQPFFVATYLPRESRGQQPGLLQVLGEIAQLWEQDPDKLRKSGAAVCAYISGKSTEDRSGAFEPEKEENQRAWPDKVLFREAAVAFLRSFDQEYGGFGQAPKFPAPHNLLFLLHYSCLEKDKTLEYIAAQTLFSMMRGGIFDHVGGGFSRYSTDRQWLVPHFEKMLYDNALLAMAYLKCWDQTKAFWSRWAAERIFLYVFRELTGEEGGFFCGQDADSEGVEGRYYVFSPEEVCRVLGQDRGEAFCRRYDITEAGNFEKMNIPNLLGNEKPWIPDEETALDCEKLYQYRRDRYPLHKDDKVLTSWSSLMAAACAKGARAAFGMEKDEGEDGSHAASVWSQCLPMAVKSLEFIRTHLVDHTGRLRVRYRDGEAAFDGHLDDYAFYALALLQMYQTVFDVSYLEEAVRVAEIMVEYFFDHKKGGFYLYASDAEQLIVRPKDTWDGAMPSGNSAAAHVLCTLAGLTAQEKWIQLRDRQLSFLAEETKSYPAGYSFSLLAVSEVLYPSRELICVLSETCGESVCRNLADLPDRGMYILVKTPENAHRLEQIAPFTKNYPLTENNKYYLCENGSCQKPQESLEEILKIGKI